MNRLFFILILFFAVEIESGTIQQTAVINESRFVSVAGVSYLINEGFEEVNSDGALGSTTDGYDSPFAYALMPTGGAGITNKWTPALVGNYALQVTNIAQTATYLRYRLPNTYSEFWVYCEMTFSYRDNAGNRTLLSIQLSGANEGRLRQAIDGGILIYNGTNSSTVTIGKATTVNTIYHLWLHWKSDGTADGGFTENGTLPTGNNYTSVSGGNGTNASKDFLLGPDSYGPATNQISYVFDHFLVSTNQITSNP